MLRYQRILEQKELRVLLPTEENPTVKADKPEEPMETLQCEGVRLWRSWCHLWETDRSEQWSQFEVIRVRCGGVCMCVMLVRPQVQTLICMTLANKRLKRGGSMLNHIAEFEQLYDRLDSIGDAVVEGQRVVTLLRSLGVEYESIIVALRTIPCNMSWDDLTARLQDEYERRESAKNDG
jgi:gag-polypeptide of LTR copia-type